MDSEHKHNMKRAWILYIHLHESCTYTKRILTLDKKSFGSKIYNDTDTNPEHEMTRLRTLNLK